MEKAAYFLYALLQWSKYKSHVNKSSHNKAALNFEFNAGFFYFTSYYERLRVIYASFCQKIKIGNEKRLR